MNYRNTQTIDPVTLINKKNYRNTQTIDPVTLINTKNYDNKNSRLFIFVQNGMRYKFLENSMLNLFKRERSNIKNPMTRVALDPRTIARLETIYKKEYNNARAKFIRNLINQKINHSSNNENSNFNN